MEATKSISTTEVKRKRGRPFGTFGPNKYTPEFIKNEAEELLKYGEEADIPLEYRFAANRGYFVQRMLEWAEKDELFYNALQRFKSLQVAKFVEGTMQKKFDTGMSIFALKNIAGWRDRSEDRPSVQIGEQKVLILYGTNNNGKEAYSEASPLRPTLSSSSGDTWVEGQVQDTGLRKTVR